MPDWTKTPEQIVNEADDRHSVQWDTDSTLHLLSEFIRQHTLEKDFTNYVDRIAKQDSNLVNN